MVGFRHSVVDVDNGHSFVSTVAYLDPANAIFELSLVVAVVTMVAAVVAVTLNVAVMTLNFALDEFEIDAYLVMKLVGSIVVDAVDGTSFVAETAANSECIAIVPTNDANDFVVAFRTIL